MRTVRVLVASSRDWSDFRAVELAVTDEWSRARDNFGLGNFELQFVVPVEMNRQGTVLPMRGAAQMVVDLLARSSKKDVSDLVKASLLPAMGHEVPWDVAELRQPIMSGAFGTTNTGRSDHPMDLFITDVFEQYPEIRKGLLFEVGVDDWVRKLQDHARSVGCPTELVSHMPRVAGSPRTEKKG